MKILITGAHGFIGRNLVAELRNRKYENIFCCGRNTSTEELESWCAQCDFVFHLAGINRPQNDAEFMQGNYDFTAHLLQFLEKYHNNAPILFSSSIQADCDNLYGKSKKAGEEAVFTHAQATGSSAYIFRLPNVFGKWSRPNYNSAVATFCHNIARDLPITVNNRNTVLELVYIDDVINAFINTLQGKVIQKDTFCKVSTTHYARLGKIVDLLTSFKKSRKTLTIPNMADDFERKLYSTYLSFLSQDAFSYPLSMHSDERGSFTEILRTLEHGQCSVNISKAGITKGNHWHHSKNEKFVVVSGKGCIQLRQIGTDKIIEYHVSGEHIKVVDIPPGYTHNIINEGENELVTVMWVNEPFNPNQPDTYFEKV